MTDEQRHEPPIGVDKDMEMVSDGIEALRELASDPEKSGDGARVYDFSIGWGVLLSGRLERLEHYYRAGELADKQEHRYQELRLELEEATPHIESLGVGKPTVPLEG